MGTVETPVHYCNWLLGMGGSPIRLDVALTIPPKATKSPIMMAGHAAPGSVSKLAFCIDAFSLGSTRESRDGEDQLKSGLRIILRCACVNEKRTIIWFLEHKPHGCLLFVVPVLERCGVPTVVSDV